MLLLLLLLLMFWVVLLVERRIVSIQLIEGKVERTRTLYISLSLVGVDPDVLRVCGNNLAKCIRDRQEEARQKGCIG